VQISAKRFEEYVITLVRPGLKKYISDKWRSDVLLLASLMSIFVGIPLLCAIMLMVETFSILAGIIIFIVGVTIIAESFWILSSMSMSSWIFECNNEGKLPNIFTPYQHNNKVEYINYY
jgi:hypothetical protein